MGPADRCRRRFLELYPGGFEDDAYLQQERGPLVRAQERWRGALGRQVFRARLDAKQFAGLAREAVSVASQARLLPAADKLALKAATELARNARVFAEALYRRLYGRGHDPQRFARWRRTLGALPLPAVTWPMATAFAFLADPAHHLVLLPAVTRRAAAAYGFELLYAPSPGAETYASLMDLGREVRRGQRDLGLRDMIDVHAFLAAAVAARATSSSSRSRRRRRTTRSR